MTPASLSPATPSDRRTSWQNWWVVAIVAASKFASASRRLRRRGGELVGSAVREPGQELVLPDGRRVVDRAGRVDELVADPLAQLLAGGPAERDEQHLVERRLALGDVAGDQPGQGEGLAGAGTGFEHGGGRTGRAARPAGRRLPSDRSPLAAQQGQPQPGGVRAEPGVLALGRLAGAHRPEQCVERGPAPPHPRVGGVGVLGGVLRCSATSGRAASLGSSPSSRALAHANDVFSGSGSGSRRPAS